LNFIRRAITPISIGLLIIVAAVAPFTILRSSPVIAPPILDPNFELWVGNASERHLVVWHSEYVTAIGDSISLTQTTVNHAKALEFDLFKENESGSTYVFVSQDIDGPGLASLFNLNISIWVLRESCLCNSSSTLGNEVFGVELNDGTHVLTYIFSTLPTRPQLLWDRRIIFFATPSGQWVKVPLNFAREYYSAQWSRPARVTLGIIFGAGIDVTGWRRAYLHNFTWSNPTKTQETDLTRPSNQLPDQTLLQSSSASLRMVGASIVENWSKDLTMDYNEKPARCL